MLKLNLGCHTRAKPGYINIDRDKYPGVDRVGNVDDLSEFESDSIDEVYASNILEHFPHTDTKRVIKEWHRVLKKDGILCLSVPDFDRAIEVYLACGLGDWVRNFLWGDQCYAGAFHYTAFNEKTLTAILQEMGFTDISRVEKLPNSSPGECSNLLSTYDKRPICLNLISIKA